ncbi:RNA polymerase sigma factor [Lutispora sp.]|uniref:RNA polymerase sigma factor n=1 Tax=Lutispora sp. TaxID=2828727 RepID=UPI002B203F9E|nr:RNA polymerase sigma factor [Lutispora sp.]MEA4960725.1 RNA polymerase sigma factor [Lutispora sp.]
MNDQISKELLLSCKKRDKQAFSELCKSYERYLFTLCFRYAGNEHDALDLVQEIYIKIFRFIDKYNIDKPFHPWIRKVAVNTCLNFIREIKSNVISLNAVANNNVPLEEILPSCEDLEYRIEKIELKKTIEKLLKELTPRQRMVISLRYYEDLTYKDIALTLDQPIGTVKTDLYRARNALKEYLSGEMEV